MKTRNLDEIRARVGHEPCEDCGDDSETFILTADTLAYVCYGCWTDRHAKRAEARKKDPHKNQRAFHKKMARAFRQHGEHENAARAERAARAVS